LRLRRSERTAFRRSRRAWSGVAIVAIAASIGLAACGGDDDEGTTAATTAPTGAAGGAAQDVKISETDFELDPSDPSVEAGTVTFEITNDGETLHNLEVEGPSGEAELPEDLQPGDSGELTVDLNEPGTYEMYCPVGNHRDLGMEGEITVKG